MIIAVFSVLVVLIGSTQAETLEDIIVNADNSPGELFDRNVLGEYDNSNSIDDFPVKLRSATNQVRFLRFHFVRTCTKYRIRLTFLVSSEQKSLLCENIANPDPVLG